VSLSLSLRSRWERGLGLFSRPFMDKRGDEGERGKEGGVSA